MPEVNEQAVATAREAVTTARQALTEVQDALAEAAKALDLEEPEESSPEQMAARRFGTN